MLSTTSLYIELAIIGLETLLGLHFIGKCLGFNTALIKTISESTYSSIIFIGAIYVIGLIFDRIADWILKPVERKIRDKVFIKYKDEINASDIKTSLLIDINDRQQKYIDFNRNRTRIIRGTSINIIFVAFCISLYFACKALFFNIAVVAAISSLIFLICIKTHNALVYDFYDKLVLFDLNNRKNNKGNG